MSINSVQPVRPLEAGVELGQTASAAAPDFSSLLHSAYKRIEHSGVEAARSVEGFLTGESQDLHSVALAGQRASLQFEMLLQVRNKIVQAYQEVMRMQL